MKNGQTGLLGANTTRAPHVSPLLATSSRLLGLDYTLEEAIKPGDMRGVQESCLTTHFSILHPTLRTVVPILFVSKIHIDSWMNWPTLLLMSEEAMMLCWKQLDTSGLVEFSGVSLIHCQLGKGVPIISQCHIAMYASSNIATLYIYHLSMEWVIHV